MTPADDVLTIELQMKRGEYNPSRPFSTLKQAKMVYDVILIPFSFGSWALYPPLITESLAFIIYSQHM